MYIIDTLSQIFIDTNWAEGVVSGHGGEVGVADDLEHDIGRERINLLFTLRETPCTYLFGFLY